MHTQLRVIHQDLKPSNVLIDEEGAVKIIDFGLCNQIAAEKQTALMEWKIGTTGYQAPEVESGGFVSTAIDIWSFGIIIHELATS